MRKLVTIWLILVVALGLVSVTPATAEEEDLRRGRIRERTARGKVETEKAKEKEEQKIKAVIYHLDQAKASEVKDIVKLIFKSLPSQTSVEVTGETNQLVISAPEYLHSEIRKVITQIDKMHGPAGPGRSMPMTRMTGIAITPPPGLGRDVTSYVTPFGDIELFGGYGLQIPSVSEKAQRIAELEQKSHQLSTKYRKYRGAREEEKEEIKEELYKLINELFDLKQEERKAKIERLEKELATLQSTIMKRTENKEAIVNRRLSDLTGQEHYLNW